jgi:hypothetical protein
VEALTCNLVSRPDGGGQKHFIIGLTVGASFALFGQSSKDNLELFQAPQGSERTGSFKGGCRVCSHFLRRRFHGQIAARQKGEWLAMK